MISGGYRQINFRNYRLSEKVKEAMEKALMEFDSNHNALFQQDQIIKALVTILKENENQVFYFIHNIFRYDRDNDGKITPQQFTNFCLQQHFGQMAIQRLHRKGYYSRGSERIMNLQEFQNTLNYCLNIIDAAGTHTQYLTCFEDVDSDCDGYITYQEYFMFLKQYFGSQSPIYVPINPIPPKPQPSPPTKLPQPPKPVQEQYIDISGLSVQQKIARLIYTQLKIKVMQRDANKNLTLEQNQIDDIITNIFKFGFSQQTNFQQNILNNANKIDYEQLMKKIVVYQICELDPKKNIFDEQMNKQQFILNFNRAANFVDIKPDNKLLAKYFGKIDISKGGQISKNTYKSSLKNIFELYLFDKRGLPRRSSFQSQNSYY